MQEPDEQNQMVSDNESLDSEGYSKHDPYAAMAKKIDRKKRAEQEFEQSRVNKLTKKVIENKENISFFERNLKRIIVFAVLVCMIAGNSDKIYENYASMNPEYGFKMSEFHLMAILVDMKRELIMLGVSLGLFLAARSVNDWLDRCEEEEALQKQKEEDERLK